MKKFSILMVMVFVFTAVLGVSPAAACDEACACPGVGSPGYWKNHPEAWPVELVYVGGVFYTKEEALALMNLPVKNDKSLTMFKSVVATRLNWESGCSDEAALPWFAQGDWWLHNFPPGSGIDANTEAWQYSHGELIYYWLDQFNNGYLTCPARQ